jgi:hypothetical protein
MVYVPKNKISNFLIFDTSIFEHIDEEFMKDAWYRIKAMHTHETNPCIEARFLMNFYFDCKGWGKHVLDLATRGSFKLLPPSEASQVIVNLFGTYNEEDRILKDLKTTMDTFQKKVDICTCKLPNRQNI